MSYNVLVIGGSGTGKSTAIRTLPSEETFIINVLDKNLPFRGAAKKYIEATAENPTGNYMCVDKSSTMLKIIDRVDKVRTDIKYLVIDDFGYTITQEFITKALVKGYDKFSEIAMSAWSILNRIKSIRKDLICFLIMHTDIKEDGVSKPKTIGKMLDEKVCIEGMFTHVLHSLVIDSQYYFLTNHDGAHVAKMPMGMFDNNLIPNDLKLVVDHMNDYYNKD